MSGCCKITFHDGEACVPAMERWTRSDPELRAKAIEEIRKRAMAQEVPWDVADTMELAMEVLGWGRPPLPTIMSEAKAAFDAFVLRRQRREDKK